MLQLALFEEAHVVDAAVTIQRSEEERDVDVEVNPEGRRRTEEGGRKWQERRKTKEPLRQKGNHEQKATSDKRGREHTHVTTATGTV